VDDNPHDTILIRLAFRKVGIIDAIHLVKDGAECIRYINGDGVYADRRQYPAPTLVLLDLKMPGANGFEVLKWIRGHFGCSIPVVILSSSDSEADIAAAYKEGANSYLVKPSDISKLAEMAKTIKDFWLSLNRPHPNSITAPRDHLRA
jgi:CheY-like chemotaxis protein